jgi:hypothetical protein
MTVSMRASRDSLEADAVDALTDVLTQAGFQVRQGGWRGQDAFSVEHRCGQPHIAFVNISVTLAAEYPRTGLRIDRAFGPITATRLPGPVATGGHPSG